MSPYSSFGFEVRVSDVCDNEAAAPVAAFEVLTAALGMFVGVLEVLADVLGYM
jgi:hypothetical protein